MSDSGLHSLKGKEMYSDNVINDSILFKRSKDEWKSER